MTCCKIFLPSKLQKKTQNKTSCKSLFYFFKINVVELTNAVDAILYMSDIAKWFPNTSMSFL